MKQANHHRLDELERKVKPPRAQIIFGDEKADPDSDFVIRILPVPTPKIQNAPDDEIIKP